MNILSAIKKEYENQNVLVTGGTGLIGRQIVDILVNVDNIA